jgi:hypothetical protein
MTLKGYVKDEACLANPRFETTVAAVDNSIYDFKIKEFKRLTEKDFKSENWSSNPALLNIEIPHVEYIDDEADNI